MLADEGVDALLPKGAIRCENEKVPERRPRLGSRLLLPGGERRGAGVGGFRWQLASVKPPEGHHRKYRGAVIRWLWETMEIIIRNGSPR
jgi:hypothetical protein